MSGLGNAFGDIGDFVSAAPRKIKNSFVDLMGPKNTGPMSYEQQMLEAKRQQMLADALLKQSADDIPIQSYKGIQAPIPWSAILAKALQGAGASYRANQAQETQRQADTADEADMNQRIELLTRGRKSLTSPSTEIDATLPQVEGLPTPQPGGTQQLALPDMQGNINPQYGYKQLSPEEVMAEAIRSGGPKTEAAMAVAAPRMFARQDKAEARAQDLKDKSRRQLSPQEVQQRGYRPGTVVTVDGFNNEQVEQAPDTLSKEAEQQRLRIAAAGRTPSQGSWGQPQTEVGPNGKPILVQYNSLGGRRVVEGGVPINVKAPPIHVQDTALKTGAALQQQDGLLGSYKDEFSGHYLVGDLSNTWKSHVPGGDPSGQSDWWANYAKYVNAVRNDQFGASLTPGEKAEFEKTVATPGMSPEETRKRLTEANRITTSAAARQVRMYKASGYNQDALEGAYGFSIDELERRDKANQEAKARAAQSNGPTADEAAAELARRRAARGKPNG